MYLIVLYVFFLNFFLTSIFGRFLGKKNIFIFNYILCILHIFISYFIFYEIIINGYFTIIDINNWINIGVLDIKWTLYFDSLTSIMLFLISTISGLVIIYSMEYMNDDPHIIRFLSYLSLFTLYMLILITSGNFVQLFLGWEGVGLSPYLLINFWFTRIQANKSAMKAIIMNRFGDFGIYFALSLIFLYFKTFDFNNIFLLNDIFLNNNIYIFNNNFNILSFINLFLFIGAIGKSSQLGLHTWLPDAMEGPTPVSALIHAATMVTAGIFVILRTTYLFETSIILLMFIGIIGILTSFFSGTVGLFQNDLKKVIAYSTCSQLGFMTFICATSSYNLSLFHLFNHGFFKALLFLGAGSIIHSIQDEQDMRQMGSFIKILPFTYISMLIGSLSLSGYPFLTGYYSKDIIIELLKINYKINIIFIYYISLICIILTVLYSIRLLFLTFIDKYKGNIFYILNIHYSKFKINMVLFFLIIYSIFIGYIMKDLFIGLGTDVWNNVFFIYIINNNYLESEYLYYIYKLFPLLFSFIGFWIFIICYNKINYIYLYKLYNYINFKKFYFFFNKKWYFDLIYNIIFIKIFFFISYHITFKLIDRGLLEYFGPLNIVRIFNKLSYRISQIQTGFLYHYIFIIFIFIICLIFYNYFLFINFYLLLFILLSIIFYKIIN